MANLLRVRVAISGSTVGPSISTFYRLTVDSDVSDLKGLWTTWATLMPSSTVITVPNSCDTIDEASGALTGSAALTNGGTVLGSGNSAYAAGDGAFAVWTTALIVGKRRLQGRTFIVPLGMGYQSSNGQVSNTTRATLDGAINTYLGAGKARVYHRPKKGMTTGGISAFVLAGHTATTPTALRSRRY
jgi:hypothetical protein